MPSARGRLGARGEEIARQHLVSKGYEVLATNFRSQWGEVDIVARDGGCLVFVEVRTRRSVDKFGTPQESITAQKRERLVATAETYLQALPAPPEDWRIDLISVRLDRPVEAGQVEHIQDAISSTEGVRRVLEKGRSRVEINTVRLQNWAYVKMGWAVLGVAFITMTAGCEPAGEIVMTNELDEPVIAITRQIDVGQWARTEYEWTRINPGETKVVAGGVTDPEHIRAETLSGEIVCSWVKEEHNGFPREVHAVVNETCPKDPVPTPPPEKTERNRDSFVKTPRQAGARQG